MRWSLLTIILISFISCEKPDLKSSEKEEFETVFTDSVINENLGIKIKFNTFDLYDTSFNYLYSTCMFRDVGFRLIDQNYEPVQEHESDWHVVESDSMMRMTITFRNAYSRYVADQNHAMSMFYENCAIQTAKRSYIKPIFGNSENINDRLISYLCFKYTIDHIDKTYHSVSLKAETFVDSTEITFNFNCFAQDCSGTENTFLKILRSVEIVRQD